MPTAFAAADRVWAGHTLAPSNDGTVTLFAESYTEQIRELKSEVEELRGVLRKISEKLQDNAEFDDELRRLLFSV